MYPSVEKFKLAADLSLASYTTAAVASTVALKANMWQVGGVLEVTNNSSTVTLKCYPYLDSDRTVTGDALQMSALHVTNVATAITVAATSSGGSVFSVANPFSSVKAPLPLALPYGMQFTLVTSSVTSTPGTVSAEVFAVPVTGR